MKERYLIYVACLQVNIGVCAASAQKQMKDSPDVWKEYNTSAILFEDKASGTLELDICHWIIPDAELYIKGQALTILATLYNLPENSIPTVYKSHSGLFLRVVGDPRISA